MKINTTRFGEIEVADNSVFEFLIPILGYENEKDFVLIDANENSMFKWLQSTKTPELAFAVTVAGFFNIDYSFELPEVHQDELGIQDADDILAMNIVVIPHDNPRNATINLLAPLIFNVKNKKAGQIVLNGTDFRVDCPLFEVGEPC